MKISWITKLAVSIVAIFSLIAFESREYKEEICHDVIVNVNNQYDNYFIDEHDVLNMMTNDGQDVLVGKTFSDIILKTVESRIKNEAYIKKILILDIGILSFSPNLVHTKCLCFEKILNSFHLSKYLDKYQTKIYSYTKIASFLF